MKTSRASFFSDDDLDIEECFPRHPAGASDHVRRIGTSIFWVALIVIVAARVAFFQPDLFAAFHDPIPKPCCTTIR